MSNTPEYDKWLAGKPEEIRQLAAEFPPGTIFIHPDGNRHYVIGYAEGGGIIASPISPFTDFKNAMKKENQAVAHVQCVRDSIKKSVQ